MLSAPPAPATGRVQTLMSVDADRVVNLCLSVHELWSLPLQIALALWLLWTQVCLTVCSFMRCFVFTESRHSDLTPKLARQARELLNSQWDM